MEVTSTTLSSLFQQMTTLYAYIWNRVSRKRHLPEMHGPADSVELTQLAPENATSDRGTTPEP